MADGGIQPGSGVRPPRLVGAAEGADFASLLSASFRRLWLLAAGIVRDRTLAEDIVQEAAMIGLEKWSSFQPGSSFMAWMGQTVRFVAMNHIRRTKRRRTSSVDPAMIDASNIAPESSNPVTSRAADDRDQLHFDDRLMKALDDVAPVARTCLLLRTLDDMSYAEISVLLDIPEGTAMSHVHRARGQMRAQLGAGMDPADTERRAAP